jgi:NDP-sugar pyrophosphorylase family protein
MTQQAVVLAGGLATRMLPHTATCPKALLPVAGRAFIAWKLEALARAGLTDVILCVGHLGDAVRAFVGEGTAFGVHVRYSEDGPTPQGTAGALCRADSMLNDTFLVTYGDSYLPFDYAGPLRDLRAHPDALGTLAVIENHDRWDRSNASVHDTHVSRYDKHARDESLTWIDYGAMALRREVLSRIPSSRATGLDELQSTLARERRLRAYPAVERFYEIGSPEGLLELDAFLRQETGALA